MQPTQDQVSPQGDTGTSAFAPQPAPAANPKRGRYIAAGALVAVVAAAAVGFTVLGKDAATTAPADRLATAVDLTLSSGPMRVTTTQNGVESTAQIDHSKGIAYTDSAAGGPMGAAFTTFLRDGDMFIKFDEASAGTEAGQWYTLPVGESGMGSMLQQAFDPEFAVSMLKTAHDVTEGGTENVDGVDATHYVVTVDKQAVVDKTLEAMQTENGPAMPDEVRSGMEAMISDTTEYWVDESGKLVKEDDGKQVKRYHDFGVPLDLPEIDESTVEPMPFS